MENTLYSGSAAKLKIKHTSLAAEARLIRKEELKYCAKARKTTNEDKKAALSDIRHSLRQHRTGIVRHEARATHVALAFLKGRPYERVEKNISKSGWFCPSALIGYGSNMKIQAQDRVLSIVHKYGKWNDVDKLSKELYDWYLQHPGLNHLQADKKAA